MKQHNVRTDTLSLYNLKPITMQEQSLEIIPLTIVSEVSLIYRSKIKPSLMPMIMKSQDAYHILLNNWDKDKIDFVEQFKVLYLNRGNKVIAIYELSTGGLTGTVADPRLVYVTALKLNATAIILSHNHPSGNLNPSYADKMLTEKIKAAGKMLEIHVSDHIILTSEAYFSFADEGLL